MVQEILAQTTKAFLKPISAFLEDATVSEVMINGARQIYIEQKGKLTKTNASFQDDEQLMAAVRNIAQYVGRKIDRQNPMLDARLPDGSRIHVIIPPSAHSGITMTIRKFSAERLGVSDLVKFGSLSEEAAKFLELCVVMAKNIIVSGGTSSGKTTLLNVLSSLIPADARIIVIEDAIELQLQKDHLVRLETQPADAQGKGEVSMRELLKSALRLRPDRIVIGEVRGGEAMDLLQAMNTGHSGSMSTVHANNPTLALSRLETLALMAGLDMPLVAIRSQVASAIEIVVQASRMRDGSRKITHITEVQGLDGAGNYKLLDIFNLKVNQLKATGEMPQMIAEAETKGFEVKRDIFKAAKLKA